MTNTRKGARWATLILMALIVSACAESEFLIHSAKRMTGAIEKQPKAAYKIGDPYQIQGIWYYPAEDYTYDETGIASWYGTKFHGRRTANGGVYDMNALTAAHRTLPMPSFIRVTNLENGRSLIVKVNDRGPYARGRIIDMSRRSAQLLGFHDKGTSKVRVQIMADQSRAIAARMKNSVQLAKAGTPITVDRLPKPQVTAQTLAPPPGANASPGTNKPPPIEIAKNPPDRARPLPSDRPADNADEPGIVTVRPVQQSKIFVQAGAFGQFHNANRVRARLSSVGPVKVTSVLTKGRDLFRVRVGPLSSVAEADRVLETVHGAGYPNARIVVD